jgi:hypothetical protein
VKGELLRLYAYASFYYVRENELATGGDSYTTLPTAKSLCYPSHLYSVIQHLLKPRKFSLSSIEKARNSNKEEKTMLSQAKQLLLNLWALDFILRCSTFTLPTWLSLEQTGDQFQYEPSHVEESNHTDSGGQTQHTS